MRLKDKVAVVTGGGRGIGVAVAHSLAEEGAAVVLVARSKDQIEAVAAALTKAGHQAWAVPCDVTSKEQVEALARRVEELAGPADILVNNAGIATSAALKSQDLDEWNRIFAVNATGVFLCTQAFMPQMVAQRWGRVVTVASIAGLAGAPYIGAYSASKHAVIGFTRSIAAEVAAKGVTVNAVCPGYVDTPMTDQSLDRIQEKTGISRQEARAKLEKMSPQNRLFQPEEVAYLVLSLCDPRAGGVNGQTVVIDGGALQR